MSIFGKDGLKQKWFGNVFCNPPYGNEIGKWVKKCFDEIHDPEGEAESIVLLIPARTDTRYFHDYIYKKADEIRFIKGRLKFEVAGVAGGCTFSVNVSNI